MAGRGRRVIHRQLSLYPLFGLKDKTIFHNFLIQK
jgi:hypothetical protein